MKNADREEGQRREARTLSVHSQDTTLRIRLRQTLGSDLDFVLNAERSDENSNFVIVWSYEQHHQTLSSKDFLHLIVERCDDNNPIGSLVILSMLRSEYQTPQNS